MTDLEVERELREARETLKAVDNIFAGWSYGDVFSRVEQMRLMVRDFLARTEEET